MGAWQGDGLLEEDVQQWDLRWSRVRRTLTDFYFAFNLPIEILHHILDEILIQQADGRNAGPDHSLPFNPELAPLELVLRQAQKYEALPKEERSAVHHHLQELRVVLLKSLVSDQLAFIHIARRWFDTEDFNMILEHRIGTGKIGGKSAGLLLAYKILKRTAPEIFNQIHLPHSHFIGADVFYDFIAVNHLEFLNQKYKSADQIREEYPKIQERYAAARFPEEVAPQLREILRQAGKTPLIVRSSSLLEDNFGMSFAGKYLSIFCPNQGTLKENLRDLTLAIRQIYASVFGPDALIYRRRVGLLDYDERMAIRGDQAGCWHHAACLFDIQQLILRTFDDHAWVHELLGILLAKKLRFIESMKGARFDLIETGGGAASSTLISPALHAEYCLPYDRKMHDALHTLGFRVVYHTCGGTKGIEEHIVGNDCDASETLAPTSIGGNQEPWEFKAKIGGRLALIGGLDQFNVLTEGSQETIRAKVRELFERVGPEGGYILSCSDHFFETPPENIRVYAEAARACVY